MTLVGKKILMVIASQNFRDEEYQQPKQIFEQNEAEVTTASSTTGQITGMLGGTATASLTIDKIQAQDYDAVVFVGGTGASEFFSNTRAHEIAIETFKSGKIIAAICIAPSTLANAGILNNKNATAYPSEQSNLENRGATYTGEAVTRDGSIITGRGPEAASQFGNEIVSALGS